MTFNPIVETLATLKIQFQEVRNWSVRLCAPLQAEDFVAQPIIDVSPPKWHLGHSTWFYETFILCPHLGGYQAFDPRLNWFFNSYYESQGPRINRAMRGNMTRPSLEQIMAYRVHVDRHLLQWLDQQEADKFPSDLAELLTIGLQHEQQHQELLLTDIKYILGNNPFFPAYRTREPIPPVPSRPAEWLTVPAGLYEIGFQEEGFCWDNELSRHPYYLGDYSVQDRLVTNREYLAFMEAGGYTDYSHWLSEGWEWAKNQETKAPLYWFQQDGAWYEYTLHGLEPVQMEAPVTHINYFEADAYAAWRGLRLPTEFEWETACRLYAPSRPDAGNFMEGQQLHPQPATDPADYQFWGHAWEWTASAYLPYPNYVRFKGALGEYNGKFMINQMVLRGGSCATPAQHLRISYRNFFQTEKRWQFTGLRLAK